MSISISTSTNRGSRFAAPAYAHELLWGGAPTPIAASEAGIPPARGPERWNTPLAILCGIADGGWRNLRPAPLLRPLQDDDNSAHQGRSEHGDDRHQPVGEDRSLKASAEMGCPFDFSAGTGANHTRRR